MYGVRIHDMHDKYVRLSQKATEGLAAARVPGRFWVEHFPLLQHIPPWMPFSAARKSGDFYRPIVSAARNELYDKLAEEVVSPTLLPTRRSVHRQISVMEQPASPLRRN